MTTDRPTRRLRIVWVTNNYTPYTSGVVQSIKSYAQALQELGNELIIISLDFLGSYHSDPPWVKRIPSILRFTRHGNHMAVPWRQEQHIRFLVQEYKPDIIHTHHPFLLGASALKVAKELGIPIVFTHHTLYEAYVHHVPLPGVIMRPFIKKRVMNYCKRVDRVIAPSLPIAHMLQEYGIFNAAVIPSGVRSTLLTEEIMATPNHVNTLLVVSRFAQEKNLMAIFDAYAQLPQNRYTLIFAGYGPEGVALRRYAYDTLGLSEQYVRIIYRPCEETLKRLYASAHLFLFASPSDTQGLVLAEAMTHGVPVIALDGPGQRAIIQEAQNGFIVDSSQAMAEKIEYCAAMPEIYQQLRAHAWQTSRDYNPHVLVHTLLALYRELVQ
jgi:1,2-diacylglycerol 3-alpha-glucosyltransferase